MFSASANLLFEQIEYQYTDTSWGTWRRYVSPSGALFEEFTSTRHFGSLPLFHYTRGRSPETGKLVVAKGVVAIGRLARGFIAIGHASMGIIAIGQLAIGILFGFGQASTGVFSIGQLAIGLLFGLGQVATGEVAIAQIAYGEFVLAQFGWGEHVWDMRATDLKAKQFFQPFIDFWK
jgi:hypothetical protein